VTNIIAQAPPVLEAMTGIKLTELMKSVPGLSQPPIEVQPIARARRSEPCEVAEPTCVGPDALNLAMEVLGQGVCYTMTNIGKRARQVALQGSGDLGQVRVAQSNGGFTPLAEEHLCAVLARAVKELAEALFERPDLRGLQRQPCQRVQGLLLFLGEVFV
jgi:hypothetical protein